MSSATAETRWALAVPRPLAFGGWEFVLTGPAEKRLEWWPGDTHLMWMSRPFLSAPVYPATPKNAKAAAAALVDLLNEEQAA